MAAYRRVYDSSHLQADCQEPGSVRERLKGFGHILYAARLDRLKAETLELRRLKHDLTTMFSIIRGFVDILTVIAFCHVIDCESVHTRCHNLRLYKEQCNVNCRSNAFVCRNINV